MIVQIYKYYFKDINFHILAYLCVREKHIK